MQMVLGDPSEMAAQLQGRHDPQVENNCCRNLGQISPSLSRGLMSTPIQGAQQTCSKSQSLKGAWVVGSEGQGEHSEA